MFISNAEKDSINSSINLIKGQIELLLVEIQELKNRKPVMAIKAVKPKKAYRPSPLVKTAEAPWGYKKDGTPRASPGRKLPKITVSQNEQSVPN